jgi:hypothetical protein
MKAIGFAAIFAVVAGHAVAGAATGNVATTCKGTGSPAAKVLTFDATDPDTVNGLNIALQMGLTPATFPAGDIAKIATPCKRAKFTVGGLDYSLYGTDGTLPYRWATTPSHPGETAFTALMPQPKPALDWYRKYQTDNKTEAQFSTGTDMMFVLAITSNDKREIYRFYSAEPDDATLTSDMCAALSGELPIVATFTEGIGVDLSHLSDPPPKRAVACGAKA